MTNMNKSFIMCIHKTYLDVSQSRFISIITIFNAALLLVCWCRKKIVPQSLVLFFSSGWGSK